MPGWLDWSTEYRKAKGSAKKEQLNTKSRLFHLFEGMVISVKELKLECEIVKDELEQWKENRHNIQAKMEQLYSEMKQALEEKYKKKRVN